MHNKLCALLALTAVLGGCSAESQQNAPRDALPEPDSRGAKLVMEYCSGCHAPPQPGAHSAPAWPAVVERMQHRRAGKGFPPVPAPEVGEILDYLQRHARSV